MGIIQTIAIIFIVLIVISTFIVEPRLSADYYKAAGKSAIVLVKNVKDVFVKEDDEQVKEKMQEAQQHNFQAQQN